MKRFLLKITSGPENSFSYIKEDYQYFYDEFHYHPEFELTLILKGEGTRFVGDRIESFGPGDLILVGPNLPHVWKNNEAYYQDNSNLTASSIVIHFAKNFLGDYFFGIPEMNKISDILKMSERGLRIKGETRKEVSDKLLAMASINQTEKLLSLLSILNTISNSDEHEILASQGFILSYLPEESSRIKNVYKYVINNFKEDISLESVAEVANMSETAFCRYFRQRTQKTFSKFLNEVRIGYACKLLIENKMKISQICYESGFKNLSNFNKQFKLVMNITPYQYISTNRGKDNLKRIMSRSKSIKSSR